MTSEDAGTAGVSAPPLLSVRDLSVSFTVGGKELRAVSDLSFDLGAGQTLGVVGESGSGKSVMALALMGLLAETARLESGSVQLNGAEVTRPGLLLPAAMRGKELGMVFQDPMSSFNPIRTIGAQIEDALRVHGMDDRSARRKRVLELFEFVGIPDPQRRLSQYPHEFSGGMRQRAMIAMAVANNPKILIADEPTTALDVTVQASVMEYLKLAQRRTGAAIILITHDLGLVSEAADNIIVMYAGRVVESGRAEEIFERPRHPYTIGLLRSVPRVRGPIQPLVPIPGQVASPTARPPGCAFHPRCWIGKNEAICSTQRPALRFDAGHHGSACHFPNLTGDMAGDDAFPPSHPGETDARQPHGVTDAAT